ncbi:MAG TPA: nuclear transport factor 2 family protein [Solirubrobacteraceae bacterium]|jgi:hypothetical protein|nr:nuclear transport factor 2 family protein [Solirubrobacteraceae bacterium]
MDRAEVTAVVERFYRALNARDLAGVQALIDETFAADFAARLPPSLPYGGEHDAAQMKRLMKGLLTAPEPVIDPEAIKIERLLAAENEAVVELSFPWKLPGQEPLATGNIEWFRFAGGKLVEMLVLYRDTAPLAERVAQARAG